MSTYIPQATLMASHRFAPRHIEHPDWPGKPLCGVRGEFRDTLPSEGAYLSFVCRKCEGKVAPRMRAEAAAYDRLRERRERERR